MATFARGLWVSATSLILFGLMPFSAYAQTVFAYSSVPGDWVGGGQTRSFTPSNATFGVVSDPMLKDSISISINSGDEYWSLDIAVPKGQILAPGRHLDAERTAFRTGRSPGIDIGGAGRGCNQIWGSFNIRQVAWGSDGNVSSFEADFIQRCESSTAPPLAGVIRWKASQMSLTLDGTLVASGNKAFHGDTSTFSLYGDTHLFEYAGSGKRQDWYFLIQAPLGKTLKVGHYVTNNDPTSTRAGMAVNGISTCWTTTGTLDIQRMTVAADGQIKALYATFVQRCPGVSGSLTGTIHFGL